MPKHNNVRIKIHYSYSVCKAFAFFNRRGFRIKYTYTAPPERGHGCFKTHPSSSARFVKYVTQRSTLAQFRLLILSECANSICTIENKFKILPIKIFDRNYVSIKKILDRHISSFQYINKKVRSLPYRHLMKRSLLCTGRRT